MHKMPKERMRAIGVIVTLAGVAALLISFLFATGSQPGRDFLGNLSQMEIVIREGELIQGELIQRTIPQETDSSPRELESAAHPMEQLREMARALPPPPMPLRGPSRVEGRVVIPLKYALSVSILTVLVGIGMVILAKDHRLIAKK